MSDSANTAPLLECGRRLRVRGWHLASRVRHGGPRVPPAREELRSKDRWAGRLGRTQSFDVPAMAHRSINGELPCTLRFADFLNLGAQAQV